MLTEVSAALGRQALDTFDAVQISTPGSMNDQVVLLKARHRLSDEEIREALNGAARAAGYEMVEAQWKGLPFFEWRPLAGVTQTDAGVTRTSPRLGPRMLVLLSPGEMVVVSRFRFDAIVASLDVAPNEDAGPSAPLAAWPPCLLAMGVDESRFPSDAVAVLSASAALPDGPAPTATFVYSGRPMPYGITAVVEMEPTLSLDVVGEFAQEVAARFWPVSRQLPNGTARAKLILSPALVLPLAADATFSQQERTVNVREVATNDLVERLWPARPAAPEEAR